MFTGLVQEIGEIDDAWTIPEGRRLRITGSRALDGIHQGDSIAVSGVCQTVAQVVDPEHVEVIAVGETLARTTLASLVRGAAVNLERPLRVGEPLGGHWVQGHVDARGRIEARTHRGDDLAFVIAIHQGLAPFVVEKGSIAVDGVSLTVGAVQDDADATRLTVHIIPETVARTLFGRYRERDEVNIEVDILAKYTRRMLDWSLLRGGRGAGWQ